MLDEGPEGFVVDSLLFPMGGLARYLDTRGPLLPDDELACGRAWLGQPLRLLDLRAAAPGEVIDAVDARTGERLGISGWAEGADRPQGGGPAVLARPLPVGDVWLLSGAVVTVPPSLRAEALELIEGDVGPSGLRQLLAAIRDDAPRGQVLPFPGGRR